MFYALQDDAGRYWPRESGMLASKAEDAFLFESRRAAEQQRDKIHARNPKGPFPWRVVAVLAVKFDPNRLPHNGS